MWWWGALRGSMIEKWKGQGKDREQDTNREKMRGTGSRAEVEKEGKEEKGGRTEGKREKSRDRVQDKVMEKKILTGFRLKVKE